MEGWSLRTLLLKPVMPCPPWKYPVFSRHFWVHDFQGTFKVGYVIVPRRIYLKPSQKKKTYCNSPEVWLFAPEVCYRNPNRKPDRRKTFPTIFPGVNSLLNFGGHKYPPAFKPLYLLALVDGMPCRTYQARHTTCALPGDDPTSICLLRGVLVILGGPHLNLPSKAGTRLEEEKTQELGTYRNP